MSPDKKTLIVPVSLVTVGTGWLLSTLGIVPELDWVWVIGLAAIGLLTFAVGQFNKLTVVVGPMFLLTSCLSVLRQTGRLTFDVEVPVLVIALGMLMMVARMAVIPSPNWMIQRPPHTDGEPRLS